MMYSSQRKSHAPLRLLALLTALLLLGTLFACTPTPQTPEDPGDNGSEPGFWLVKDGVANVRIVRNELLSSGSDTVKAAVALRLAIEAQTGVAPDIVTDWDDKDDNAGIPEIVVGLTNRDICDRIPEDAPDNAFYLIVDGCKLFVGGVSEQANERAVEYLIEHYLSKATTGAFGVSAILFEMMTFPYQYPTELYVFHTIKSVTGEEMTSVEYCDMVRLLSSLQGRVNKTSAATGRYVYQMFDGFDGFWLDYVSQDGKLLEDATRHDLGSWAEVWREFEDFIRDARLVLWDPDVPATANVAATVCSVEGYLPVRYDESEGSLCRWLLDQGVDVGLSLVGIFDGEEGTRIGDTQLLSTGSIKCDPYLWALEVYGERVNPAMIAYILDGATQVADNPMYLAAESTNPDWNQLYSHDYLIYNECFFVDLTCVEDEKPCDDPTQPMGCDAETLDTILSYFHERNNGKMTKLMGFPPWYVKYSTHGNRGRLNPTELEFAFTATITAYNCVKEADAAHPAWMTNGSLYTQYTPTATYENTTPPEQLTFDPDTYYFTIYMGDYDSSAWLKARVPTFFMQDEGRGKYPLMWAFNPNLSDRVPMIFDYVYENASPNDFFVTGDSGAGYINPDMLDDLDVWAEYNAPYLEKFDMDIVGFIITAGGMDEDIMQSYATFAPVGAFHNDSSQQLTVLGGKTVFMHLMNEIVPVYEDFTKQQMYDYIMGTGTNFAAYRAVCKSPTEINAAIDRFIAYAEEKNPGATYRCVDPYTLFDLVLQSGQGEWLR